MRISDWSSDVCSSDLEWIDKLEDDTTQGHIEGISDIYNEAATVYVIRRADRNIWVNFVTNSALGNWIILETAPFEPTAKLINHSAIKQSLELGSASCRARACSAGSTRGSTVQ